MKKRIAFIVVALTLVCFAESCIPYWYAQHQCAVGNVFLGQIISTFDQNMYCSFLRQAADGHFLFINRLTYMPHDPVFVNLEFWSMGSLQHLFGLSENGIYNLWRFLGVAGTTLGFTALASLFFKDRRKLLFVSAVFLFSGGIGFVHALLAKAGLLSLAKQYLIFGYSTTPTLALDTSTYLFPLNQVMTNPHFSFPTGLIMIGYYFFVKAELSASLRYYYWFGITMLCIGLIRPYDIIPVFAVIPVYMLLTRKPAQWFAKDSRPLLVALLIVLPALLYDLWLFHYHPIFKYWSSQGDNSFMIPSIAVHLVNFGVVGLLALLRCVLFRKYPLGRGELFLLVLVVVTLLTNHAGKFISLMPWSFQVGGYLAAPLVILAFSLPYRRLINNANTYRFALAGFVLVLLLSNAAVLYWRCFVLSDPLNRSHMYAKKDEYDAWQWLRQHTHAGEVLLSSTYSSSRIAKYTDLSVVVGHPFVSPDYKNTKEIAQRIILDSVITDSVRGDLSRLRVDYIYVGPIERQASSKSFNGCAGISRVYQNSEVSVFKVMR